MQLKTRRALSLTLVFAMVLTNAFSLGLPTKAEAANTTDLIISEYIEGSSNNKAIEIYNGTGAAVNLSDYSVELYSNGATVPTNTAYFSGTLEDGKTFVLVNGSANAELKSKMNITSTVVNFNGDDAVVLKKSEQVIDSIGQVGFDPGTEWTKDGISTVNMTLVRKDAVTAGDADPFDAFDPFLEWDGHPIDTFSYLGSHLGTVNPEPENPSELISISEARAKASGTAVTVEGIVTADNAAMGGGKLSTYIQDATAGINLYSVTPADLQEGDKVKVTGTLTSYRGLLEIVPTSIEELSTGEALPEAKPITLADLQNAHTAEPLEGQLVKVSGFVSSVPATPAGGGYNVSLIDEDFNATTVRVMEETNAINQLQEGKWYDITAILSQYDSYQILPRKAEDIQLSAEQPPAPSAAGEYSSTVASVVDGDTIHLTSPVLGSTKVRFLNIDTPETYHKVTNEADQNQLDHGLAAKEHINTLLKAGDEIILKIGEEPTDAYGRLLAEVIRKDDNVNVNLEMVRDGYASTYFIWPIGDEATYLEFQGAVKEAKDNELGIWNPEDPLMELPFVFRAREQGKGLLRYVGNYGSKEYVEPEQWADVPVEQRVFFASAEEAEANGYTALNEEPGNENIKVQLLSVNDLHGKIDVTSNIEGINYGRIDYLAAYLREREATNPNTLIVHAGDMIGGSSPVSALLQDEPTVEIMESIGFDVGTVGNHEFDEGVSELLRMINGGDHPEGTQNYDGMNFPTVAANIVYKDSGELVLDPYAIEEIGGAKIGFIGVATTQTPSMVMPTGIANIRFTDEAEAVNKYVEELKGQGVEAIVVLAHVPGDQSGETATGDITRLANEVNDEVDVIFAAHNHVKLDAIVDNKLIVQAWEYGKAFGDVELEIDPATGEIVKKTAEVVDVVQTGITPDPEVSAILQKYEELVAPKVNEVLGTSALEMVKGYPTKGIVGDMALGNMIADGMNFAMNSDFALMNGGGVRDNINAGEITWGELFNVQPFGNTLVSVDVTGAEFREILNAMINPKYGPDSFIGGATYTWSTTTNEVVDIFLPNGEKIDENATYTLTVNNYMYNQTSDKYKLIAEYGENFVQGPEDIEASVAFVKNHNGPLSYEAEGRISTDIVAPVTTVEVEGADGETYTNEDVTLTFEAVDPDGIGVRTTEYQVNQSGWTTATSSITVTTEGVNTIEYRSVDRVGNVEETKFVVVSIDKTAPVINAPEALVFDYTESFELKFDVEDALSGVENVIVELDGVVLDNPYTIDAFALAIGSHNVVVSATDKAGNETTKQFVLTITMAVQSLDELITSGAENGKITNDGIVESLLAKVKSIQDKANETAAYNQLNALKNQINAQSGKAIDQGFADLLLDAITHIQNDMQNKSEEKAA